jgi:hypothetical protein
LAFFLSFASGAGITRQVEQLGENPPPRNPLNHRRRTL